MALAARQVTLPFYSETGTPVLIGGPKVKLLVSAGGAAYLGPIELNPSNSYLLNSEQTIEISLGPGEVLYGFGANSLNPSTVYVLETER
jgi:hypothetical protein